MDYEPHIPHSDIDKLQDLYVEISRRKKSWDDDVEQVKDTLNRYYLKNEDIQSYYFSVASALGNYRADPPKVGWDVKRVATLVAASPISSIVHSTYPKSLVSQVVPMNLASRLVVQSYLYDTSIEIIISNLMSHLKSAKEKEKIFKKKISTNKILIQELSHRIFLLEQNTIHLPKWSKKHTTYLYQICKIFIYKVYPLLIFIMLYYIISPNRSTEYNDDYKAIANGDL